MSKKPRLTTWLIVFAMLLSAGAFCGLLESIYRLARLGGAQSVDAIVVMGASQWNGVPSPVFQARLNHAHGLYTKGYAPVIILTGGVGEGEQVSESASGKTYLIKKGVAESNIIIEEKGRTTLQSLQAVAAIVKQQKMNQIMLVSDGFHLFRLRVMARDLGLDTAASPAMESPIFPGTLIEFRYAVREVGVFVLYKLFRV